METAIERKRKKALRNVKFYSLKTITLIVLIFGALLMLFPYVYMLSNSFKSQSEIVNNSMTFYLIPKEFVLTNYTEIFSVIPLGLGFLNTLIIEVVVLLVGTFVTTLAAYSFSRINFVGKNVVFYLLLSGMMIPFITVLVPQYNMWTNLEFIDTLLPLIIPGLFGNVSMLFFLKQYADTIPNDVYEAAEMTGANFFTIYWKVFLPLVRPAILAQVIFWFLGIWNDFFGPDIYLPTLENKTLQVMIRFFDNDAGGGGGSLIYQPYVMAASVLSSIPTLTIYIIFQKYFVNTFMLSGSKH